MAIQLAILILCTGGLYASVFMLRKAILASRGRLSQASVVETATARALFGAPNSAFGIAYYAALMLAVPYLGRGPVWLASFAAATLAAAFSLYLGYSLLFRTKRSCVYCWSAHAVNWALFVVLTLAKPA